VLEDEVTVKIAGAASEPLLESIQRRNSKIHIAASTRNADSAFRGKAVANAGSG
jgi:hypothetical protein